MKITLKTRSLAVALLSATTFVAVAGCTAARKMSSPVAGGAEPAAKAEPAPTKQYQWEDMSLGKAIFQQPKATPPNN